MKTAVSVCPHNQTTLSCFYQVHFALKCHQLLYLWDGAFALVGAFSAYFLLISMSTVIRVPLTREEKFVYLPCCQYRRQVYLLRLI